MRRLLLAATLLTPVAAWAQLTGPVVGTGTGQARDAAAAIAAEQAATAAAAAAQSTANTNTTGIGNETTRAQAAEALALLKSTLGQPSGPAKKDASGNITDPFVGAFSTAERPGNASINTFTWTFTGSGNTGASTGVNSVVRLNTGASGPTNSYLWPFLSNFYDATYQIPGGSVMPQNVAGVLQYIRQDAGVNWQNGHLPSQGWAADLVANDLIPWGSPGYPAYPPTASSLLGLEIDIAALGLDRNNTRAVLSLDCKPALNNATLFVECGTVIGGGDTGTTIGGVRQTSVHDVIHTSYKATHAILNTVDNTLPPGAREVWLGDSGKVAIGAAGFPWIEKDPVTGAMEVVQNGKLANPVVTAGGSGYTTCAATLSGGGGGPVDLACTVSGGKVTAVTLDATFYGPAVSGNDFTSAPTITITGDGSGATATVAIVAEVSTPIGAGLAVQPNTVVYSGSGTMSPYMLGRPIAFVGSAASTITLPGYYYTQTRQGLVTVFQNRGSAPVTIVSNTGTKIDFPPNNNVVLQPGDSALIMLDTDSNWRVISVNRVFAKPPAYTVSTLPGCSATYQDAIAVVTDATAPTYRGSLTGGGAVRTPVYCDGTSWTAH